MTRFTEATNRKVLSREDAEQLGRVRHLLVDPATHRVVALHIDGRRRRARLVDWNAVTGFGPDAVLIASADVVRGPDGPEEEASVAGDRTLTARRALTDGGDAVGTVRDAEFDETSGKITRIETDTAEFRGDQLLAIGPYCVILRAEA